jgi:hypothetical protein
MAVGDRPSTFGIFLVPKAKSLKRILHFWPRCGKGIHCLRICSEYGYCEPYALGANTRLQKSICLYSPQFQGTNQHDAQEFLSTLLDGLHEDLNRIIDKPTIETRPEREAELEALPIQIASEQEWKIYRMRNNSLVVDYFQGQFRNRMECMTCHKGRSPLYSGR